MGDVIVIYESGTGHVEYIVQALSDAVAIHEEASEESWKYGCDFRSLAWLRNPVGLAEMRRQPTLEAMPAIRASFQQRAYRLDETEWQAMQRMIEHKNSETKSLFGQLAELSPSSRPADEAAIQQRLKSSLAPFRHVGLKLQLYKGDDGKSGAQFSCAVGRIDLLTTDDGGDFVVVELKNRRATRNDFGQLASYVGWVRTNLATNQEVFGILGS